MARKCSFAKISSKTSIGQEGRKAFWLQNVKRNCAFWSLRFRGNVFRKNPNWNLSRESKPSTRDVEIPNMQAACLMVIEKYWEHICAKYESILFSNNQSNWKLSAENIMNESRTLNLKNSTWKKKQRPKSMRLRRSIFKSTMGSCESKHFASKQNQKI